MNDDYSITDTIVLENAALDASLRRMSMQRGGLRNSQQSSSKIIAAVEKQPIPVSRGGFVNGRVLLQHKSTNPGCSILQGRELSILEYPDEKSYESFVDRLKAELKNHNNTHYLLCPECFPSSYKNMTSQEDKRFLEGIRIGGRYNNELSLKDGYYMIRESETIKLTYLFRKPTKARIFHMPGYGCCENHRRTIVGPYEGVNDAFSHLEMGKYHDDVMYLPCPKCFAEGVYKDNKYYSEKLQMLTFDLTVNGFYK